MDEEQPLRGGCSCGRNHYLIALPSEATLESLQVVYDDRAEHSKPATHIEHRE